MKMGKAMSLMSMASLIPMDYVVDKGQYALEMINSRTQQLASMPLENERKSDLRLDHVSDPM